MGEKKIDEIYLEKQTSFIYLEKQTFLLMLMYYPSYMIVTL